MDLKTSTQLKSLKINNKHKCDNVSFRIGPKAALRNNNSMKALRFSENIKKM